MALAVVALRWAGCALRLAASKSSLRELDAESSLKRQSAIAVVIAA